MTAKERVTRAIELEGPVAKLVCCGRFGVPPPTGEPSNASRAT